VVNFEALVRHGTIAREDLKLFEFVDDPKSALALLKRKVTLEPAAEARPAFARSRCPGRA
jgi:predicted Rossmann-fold nucleotide-binding protein